MINLTVEQALDLVPTLRELMVTKLPIKAAYKVARFARKAEEQLKDYESQRVKLVKEYGTTDEKGTTSVSPENMAVFVEKLTELQKEALRIDADTVAIAELGETLLTPQQMLVMEKNKLLAN
jgi:hypothetical protein